MEAALELTLSSHLRPVFTSAWTHSAASNAAKDLLDRLRSNQIQRRKELDLPVLLWAHVDLWLPVVKRTNISFIMTPLIMQKVIACFIRSTIIIEWLY